MPPARKQLFYLSLCICLALPGAVCHAQSSGQKLPQAFVDLVDQQIWWDSAPATARNPKGLRLHFTKIDETTKDGSRIARYRVRLPGGTEGLKYALSVWQIGTRIQEMRTVNGEVYLNARGLLMTHKPRPDQENKESALNDGEVVVVVRAARGEPGRFALFNNEKNILVTGTLVPYPIVNRGGNCRLEARLASPSGAVILLYADGLKPDSYVPYRTYSENKSHDASFHSDSHGHASSFVLPFVTGRDAGVLKVSLEAKGCSASVMVPWGKGSYHLQ